MRWFGHLERKNKDDWVTACRSVEVTGLKSRGRGRMTLRECVNDDLKLLSLQPDLAILMDMWIVGGLHIRQTSLTLAQRGRNKCFQYK